MNWIQESTRTEALPLFLDGLWDDKLFMIFDLQFGSLFDVSILNHIQSGWQLLPLSVRAPKLWYLTFSFFSFGRCLILSL